MLSVVVTICPKRVRIDVAYLEVFKKEAPPPAFLNRHPVISSARVPVRAPAPPYPGPSIAHGQATPAIAVTHHRS